MTASRFLTRNITKVRAGDRRECSDFLALEEPLEIQVSIPAENAREWKTVAITMRTPGHDRELAAGFLFGEGLFRSLDQIETVFSCGARHGEQGWQNRVRLALSAGASFDPARFTRHFYTSSSCGVCGKTSMEALGLSHFEKIRDTGWQIDEELVRSLPERLREAQDVFEKTGGLHAAGIFTREGVALQVREDVGRHNAVDKVIGAQFLAGHSRLPEHILVVSGRASFELVQKAIAAGIPMLVAVGAPSSLAVELAEEFGLTLIGFTKPGGFNLYTGARRIRAEAAAVLSPPILESLTMSTDSPPPKTQTTDDTKDIHVGHRHQVAAGLPAVLQTLRFTLKEMGPVRGIGQLLRLNQKKGFDCQSCAWPSPDAERHTAEFCENGVKAVADEATTKRITREFFAQHSIAELADQSDHWLNHQGRLTEPMVRREGATHYVPISWPEAFSLLAKELHSLGHPNEAAFYTSGRTSNEAAFLYQLFARQFGTNNLPDCSNMCHESSGFALKESIGVGKGTVTLEDFDVADAIFIVGQNPGTNHPRMLTSLQRAKRNGCKIVSINPLPETGNFLFKNPQDFQHPTRALPTLLGKGTPISDLWLPVRLSGDMAVFKGIAKHLLDVESRAPGTVLDREFISAHTVGFDEYRARLDATSWDEIVYASGLTREQITAAAEIGVHAKKIICCWAMGLTQQTEAVATIQEVVNFLLLGGNVGRAGAGVCPVRGHSNVQGDRTMGVWERMDARFHDGLDREFKFTSPREHGFDVVKTIEAMLEGRVKVFFGMGGNFLSATPDTEATARGLRQCRLTAHVSTKLNRAHLVTGRQALILPCLGRTEIDRQAAGDQFVTVEDSMGIINPSRGTLEPASGDLLSEPAIVCQLARAVLGEKTTVHWEELQGDYNLIRDHVERVIPGFEPYNERIAGGPFYLPNLARTRVFETHPGKAVFTAHPLPNNDVPPGQFALMTMRSHDQFNTTIYGLDDRYRGIYNGRRVVFLNALDMDELGLVGGQIVNLTSHFHGVQRTAGNFMVTPYEIPRGCAPAYFPEANPLVPLDSVATKSGTPVSKFIPITVAPVSDATDATSRLVEEALAAAPR